MKGRPGTAGFAAAAAPAPWGGAAVPGSAAGLGVLEASWDWGIRFTRGGGHPKGHSPGGTCTIMSMAQCSSLDQCNMKKLLVLLLLSMIIVCLATLAPALLAGALTALTAARQPHCQILTPILVACLTTVVITIWAFSGGRFCTSCFTCKHLTGQGALVLAGASRSHILPG